MLRPTYDKTGSELHERYGEIRVD